MENVTKNQVEILELRNTIIEITQWMGSRDELRRHWKESVNSKIITIDITQSEQHRKKLAELQGHVEQ